MDSIIVNDEVEGGQRVLRVDCGPMTIALWPAAGGKLGSLCDKRSGREWLWRNPRMPYAATPPGPSYTATADSGGWDECFPSVAACVYPSAPWAGAPIQDHGELWSQPAELTLSEAPGTLGLHCRWRGAALPYSFERTLTLSAGAARLRCDYLATNLAAAPMPVIWSAHPLLAIEPGMAVRLPAGARLHQNVALPLGQPPLSLDPLPGPEAAAALKVWSDPLDEGWAALVARDGALTMRWDTALLPQVAVWANLGAWAGDGGAPYYNLGLEPCIGAQDSLADAVSVHQLFATLPPHGALSWWLEVELSP